MGVKARANARDLKLEFVMLRDIHPPRIASTVVSVWLSSPRPLSCFEDLPPMLRYPFWTGINEPVRCYKSVSTRFLERHGKLLKAFWPGK